MAVPSTLGLGFLGLSALVSPTAALLPAWQDIFTGLEPFKYDDELALEEETARLGYVQVSAN